MNKELLKAIAEYQTAKHNLSTALLLQIEIEAKKILKNNPHLKEFVMGMGTWYISTINGGYLGYTSRQKYMEPLQDLFREHGNEFRLTGEPMRFTAEGEKITNW